MPTKQHRKNMGTILFALVLAEAILTGCQTQQSTLTSKELFPIYGVILGKTDEDQLKKMGKADEEYGCYVIHGQNFWVDNGIFDGMYLSADKQLPLRWRNLGLDWYLSYDQWLVLLNDLGFIVTIEEAPVVGMYKDHESFNAKVKAVKRSEVPTELILDFQYSEETTTSAEGTLYSIAINMPEQLE